MTAATPELLGPIPLIESTTSVQQRRSFTVAGDLWYPRSIVGAGLVLDDLDGILAKRARK